jgi:hypothetical protein
MTAGATDNILSLAYLQLSGPLLRSWASKLSLAPLCLPARPVSGRHHVALSLANRLDPQPRYRL